jgi:hypothetical protein
MSRSSAGQGPSSSSRPFHSPDRRCVSSSGCSPAASMNVTAHTSTRTRAGASAAASPAPRSSPAVATSTSPPSVTTADRDCSTTRSTPVRQRSRPARTAAGTDPTARPLPACWVTPAPAAVELAGTAWTGMRALMTALGGRQRAVPAAARADPADGTTTRRTVRTADDERHRRPSPPEVPVDVPASRAPDGGHPRRARTGRHAITDVAPRGFGRHREGITASRLEQPGLPGRCRP